MQVVHETTILLQVSQEKMLIEGNRSRLFMKFEHLASVHWCESDYCIGQEVDSVINPRTSSYIIVFSPLLLYLLHHLKLDPTSILYDIQLHNLIAARHIFPSHIFLLHPSVDSLLPLRQHDVHEEPRRSNLC